MARRSRSRKLSNRPTKELDELLRGGAVPLVVLDPTSGHVIDANEAAEAFYGWTVEEFRTRALNIWDVSSADASEVRERLAQITAGTLTRVLGSHRTSSGELRNVEIYCGPLRVRDSTYLYGLVYDLDARKSEVAAQEKLRAVVEQTIVGIYMIENERFSYVNQRMADIFGYKVDELLGRAITDVIAEPDRHLVTENVRRRIEGQVESIRYEFRGLRKDGVQIDVGVHGTVASVQGKSMVIGVIQDITERRRTERAIQGYIGSLERTTMGAVDAIAQMVELRDPYTAGHQRRVGGLAAAIGRELGQSSDSLKGLEIAGHLHDIGKINVPAEILTKPAKLTHPEFEIVKTHAAHGGAILQNIDFPWPLAAITQQHHERLDGSGYPDALVRGAITPEARIMAVADVVEAMASHRPYRASLGIGPALEEIERHQGTKYDASVVQSCVRLFREKRYSLEQ